MNDTHRGKLAKQVKKSSYGERQSMTNMSQSIRDSIINLARDNGFEINEKTRGIDHYDKLLTLRHPVLSSNIYIDKITGISISGEIRYLKVAVHPDSYREDLENLDAGIRPAINHLTKVNRHSHSGYAGFPHVDGNSEPVASAYQIQDLDSLQMLLAGLVSKDKSYHHSWIVTPGLKRENHINNSQPRGDLPDKALIINAPWIDLILSGQKFWEMRSRACSIRGRIGLIRKGSKQIFGSADLVNSLGPFTEHELRQLRDKHAITEERLPDNEWMTKWNHAWVLENVEILPEPVRYNHPNGAVTWVNIGKQGPGI